MLPAYRTHPEFGYLCPSRGVRRALWTALAVAGFGTLAGAFVLGAGHDARDDRAVLLASVEAARPPDRGKPACDGDSWAYLDGKCIAGRAHRPRITTTTHSPPIAALPLGRRAPPPEPARASEAAAPAAPAEPERAADAALAAPEAAPGGHSTSVPNARKKAARGRSGGREVAGAKGSPHGGRRISKPKPATRWAKQLRDCVERARCPAGEQLMRAQFLPGI